MKAIIADHRWIVRASIERLFVAADPAAITVPVATGAALHRALIDHPDATLVLIDDALVADGDEGTFAHVRKRAPAAAIGVLAATADRERVLKAIYYGAVAFILTDTEEEPVARALRQLVNGQVAFPRDVLATPAVPTGVAQRSQELTPREHEVLGLIGSGRPMARIAVDLKLSPQTVRVHVMRIMQKLDLPDRPALVHHAMTRHPPSRLD